MSNPMSGNEKTSQSNQQVNMAVGDVEMVELSANPMALALSPQLENDLEQLSEQKRKALLMWYLKDQEGLLTQSEQLQAILDETTAMNNADVEKLANDVDMQDAIRFMLLNEFGDKVAGKPMLEALTKMVQQKMSQK